MHLQVMLLNPIPLNPKPLNPKPLNPKPLNPCLPNLQVGLETPKPLPRERSALRLPTATDLPIIDIDDVRGFRVCEFGVDGLGV